ncbi:hypothetical protein JAAARDRAFT_32592 [Jaapia argillacea MUCL 33604]|uniref:DUF6533 domain-containing protein n=1 Tax=Jaapia argillacea MUCL 33604 TaxID=933084 RepID=A0A067Q9M6_9AGAM|nr:hypothetical protein JAAARDRAFT_32592 [Jaapia argillacea MUCL 33604]
MAAETQALAGLVGHINLTRSCQLAAALIVVYDHVTTFDQEVELIWRRRWSISKILFLMIRYFGNAVIIAVFGIFFSEASTAEISKGLLIFQGAASTLIVWLVQILMQFRIYALYDRSRLISILLLSCFFIQAVVIAVFLVFDFRELEVTATPAPAIKFCTIARAPSFLYGLWIPIMTFESILFALALYKSACRFRSTVPDGWTGVSLLDVMIRDSVLYFFVTFAAYLMNAVVWFALPPEWIEITEAFSISLTCIMGCHLLLNLLGAYFGEDGLSSSGPSMPSNMEIQLRRLRVSRAVSLMPNIGLDSIREDYGETGRRPNDEAYELSWRWDQATGRVDEEELTAASVIL